MEPWAPFPKSAFLSKNSTPFHDFFFIYQTLDYCVLTSKRAFFVWKSVTKRTLRYPWCVQRHCLYLPFYIIFNYQFEIIWGHSLMVFASEVSCMDVCLYFAPHSIICIYSNEFGLFFENPLKRVCLDMYLWFLGG